ncbi:MAG: phosphoesterase [Flavobacteriaceae bacterium]|nr:phosphoesterase [Flavobacteriaceae bacterium]
MKKIYSLLLFFSFFLFVGCGTYAPKYLETDEVYSEEIPSKTLDKRFYLVGDAGLAADGNKNEAMKAFEKHIANKNTKEDYLIYLGDNIYPKGLPAKGAKGHDKAKAHLDAQLDAAKKFEGTTLFIPGNHDWYSKGLKGLKRQEEYVEKELKDNEAFQPENGCAIEKIELGESIVILAIDTQWYIADWDKHPTINDDCDIKSRKAFFLEIENELKKNNEKTILIAMHHPAFTYGTHGGYYNFEKHLFPTSTKIPLPVLGSLSTIVRSQGGVSPQDRYNNRYNELMKRLITLATDNDRVIFTSGHEHTLQYIERDNIKQIVSGAGVKESPVALGEGAKFVSGRRGFAVLDVYDDGSSQVKFYNAENGTAELIFSSQVHPARKDYDTSNLPEEFDETISVSAYPKEETDRSSVYEWFWGDHYRDIYGKSLEVPVHTLDELMGGFTIERKGGGHQTRSLRLIDQQGRNFALRAVRKSAVQFLQSVAFKDTYIEDDFRETLTEDFILDFYTSSHPYGTFVIGPLSDAIGLYHTNPTLFYMPKHPALGKYNEEFGDELYIIEERPDDGFLDVESFGTPDAIESTSDVLENLREDEEYKMDEPAFIKARLFDMLVGDWDRHQDQWRWARFDISKDEKIYRPIPRDRDQVFSNYDGALFDFLKTIMPTTKQFQEFDGELKDIKYINLAGIKIDRTFTQTSSREVWLEQARFIQENLTDEVIDNAFKKLPKETQNEVSERIIRLLKERRGNLLSIAERYYNYLDNLVILTATDKDDYIEITREKNATVVSISRIKDGEIKPPFKKRRIESKKTKEIWVYGLDDDDQITVNGKGNNPIRVRVVGGQNNDVYTIENGRRIKVYDHKSKPNTIAKAGSADFKFKDNYRYNIYQYDKYIDNAGSILPSVGFNPDDGIRVGVNYSTAKKAFKNDPFQVKHAISAAYYFATEGFDISYDGEYATIFDSWNVLAGARFTTENFTQNFFGFGNDTENNDDELGLDYNRVKTARRSVSLGAVKNGHYGSRLEISGKVESIEVQETEDRFISEGLFENTNLFDDHKIFGGLDVIYSYEGFDNKVSPTKAMFFKTHVGFQSNLGDTERTFGYIIPSLEFYNAISRNRKLVLRTKVQGQVNIGDNFEFYQAATLGANNGLRGFRLERFSGERSVAFTGDLRYHLAKFKTGLLPLKLGIFGGGDTGRVWIDNEDSDTWHNSYGGGFWVNAVDTISGQFGLFNSVDGLRFAFVFGLSL